MPRKDPHTIVQSASFNIQVTTNKQERSFSRINSKEIKIGEINFNRYCL